MPFEQPTHADVLFLALDPRRERLLGTEAPHWLWWKPSLRNVRAPSLPLCTSVIWWVFYHLGIFRSKNFAVLYLCMENIVVHRSIVFPRYFRFPFMADDDLQIGDTWTHPEQRGRHLARRALDLIVARYGDRHRLWYLTTMDNIASVKAAEAAGFRLVGNGVRKACLGLPCLGYFEISNICESKTKR